MNFSVEDRVFEKIPGVCFGLVSVKGLDNRASFPFVSDMLDEAIKEREDYYRDKKVKEQPELADYRRAFRTLGINPNKYMSSIEALITRIAKKKGMPRINPAVDLGNAFSIKYRLPVGVHDLDTMEGDFWVRISRRGDTFLPFGGREREAVPEGEVVYATGDKVRTRRWIWRQSDEGKIAPETKSLLFILDGFERDKEKILAARDLLADTVSRKMGRQAKKGFIDRQNTRFVTDF